MLLLALACTGPATTDTADETPVGGETETGLLDAWQDVSVTSIQQGAVPLDTPVRVNDVVVIGVAPSGIGLFVQESGEEFGGIWVYTQGGAFVHQIGQVVDVTGLVAEYDAEGEWPDSLTEIDSSAVGTIEHDGETSPGFEPVLLTDHDADLEPYEGMLVTIENLVVADGQLPYGEWSTEAGWVIDDKLLLQDTVYPGDRFDAVTGVLDYGYGQFKLQPRAPEDLVGHVSSVIGVDQLSPGQLVLTELMIDPGAECVDADDEYVELYNDSSYIVDLSGLVVSYGDGSTELGYVLAQPDSYVLLVRESPSPCYGHAGDALLPLALTQELGEVALRTPGDTLLDKVDARDWVIESGVAMGVDGEVWCPQTTPLRTDFGTPGAPNDACL